MLGHAAGNPPPPDMSAGPIAPTCSRRPAKFGDRHRQPSVKCAAWTAIVRDPRLPWTGLRPTGCTRRHDQRAQRVALPRRHPLTEYARDAPGGSRLATPGHTSAAPARFAASERADHSLPHIRRIRRTVSARAAKNTAVLIRPDGFAPPTSTSGVTSHRPPARRARAWRGATARRDHMQRTTEISVGLIRRTSRPSLAAEAFLGLASAVPGSG
jgi:hypothetical protein